PPPAWRATGLSNGLDPSQLRTQVLLRKGKQILHSAISYFLFRHFNSSDGKLVGTQFLKP
ncbi:Hypothetical predicted protein, partial [Marmota monax]